ncbi:hypothetical protein [Kitasatospora viridis]|uniref:Uncharacterized protein n=1 Tax=Kitasatospora viridis TaxID=281105 RepID=A0A561SAE9_9ACTN|nr:hypothetical protein [Kitasatospora viridis]TWF71775.1 hypothetical protein FHX73_18146 [Kitasatospora viridis]
MTEEENPGYNDDAVLVRVRPTICRRCGHLVSTALLTLEPVFHPYDPATDLPGHEGIPDPADTVRLAGIAADCVASCCGHISGSDARPESVARTLNHLEICPDHG